MSFSLLNGNISIVANIKIKASEVRDEIVSGMALVPMPMPMPVPVPAQVPRSDAFQSNNGCDPCIPS
jgi:hypothetical protein